MEKRITLLLTLASLALLTLDGCAQSGSRTYQSIDDRNSVDAELASSPTRLNMDRKIEVLAALVTYSDMYYRDHFVDGSYEFYKISAYRIIEPIELAGKSLNIRHDVSPDSGSHWREEGVILRLRMAEDALEFVAGERGFVGVQLVEILEVGEKQIEHSSM